MSIEDCKLYLIDRDKFFNELREGTKDVKFDTYQIMTIISILDNHDSWQRTEQAINKYAAKEATK